MAEVVYFFFLPCWDDVLLLFFTSKVTHYALKNRPFHVLPQAHLMQQMKHLLHQLMTPDVQMCPLMSLCIQRVEYFSNWHFVLKFEKLLANISCVTQFKSLLFYLFIANRQSF